MSRLCTLLILVAALLVLNHAINCPHDKFKDLEGWKTVVYLRVQNESNPGATYILDMERCVALYPIVETNGTWKDVHEFANRRCSVLPEGKLYSEFLIMEKKFKAPVTILLGFKVTKVVVQNATDQRLMTGIVVRDSNSNPTEIKYYSGANKKWTSESISIGLDNPSLEILYQRKTFPVCLVLKNKKSKMIECSNVNAFETVPCITSDLNQCEAFNDNVLLGCSKCLPGYQGLYCTQEIPPPPAPWHKQKKYLEYIGIGVAFLFFICTSIFACWRHRRKRRRRKASMRNENSGIDSSIAAIMNKSTVVQSTSKPASASVSRTEERPKKRKR